MMTSSKREQWPIHLAGTSLSPIGIHITHAEGMFMYAGDKKYYDCISGIAVSNVGHSNPKVIEAVKQQLDKHTHLMVYGEIVQDVQVALANRLSLLLPAQLSSVFFVNSGSEAIEGAMKLAKRYTGKSGFTAQLLAYHGSTHGALSLMSDPYFSRKFHPLLPGINFIEQDDIDSVNANITEETAAVFIEPVMGEKGYLECNKNYLQAIRKRCHETGALLVFDEVQSGYGRTGKLFAFEQYGIIPDILILAKGFGGGLPLGAFISSEKIMSSLSHDPVLGHISTFGGHPLSCAASLAALEYILENKLAEKVEAKEQLFRQLLVHPKIKKMSGKGLMLALEFENPEICHSVIDNCLKNGLLTDWFLFAEHKLRLAPPLIIDEEHIKIVCGIILESI